MQSNEFVRLINIVTEDNKHVEQSEIHGEEYTGYEDGKKGPFACRNCEYSDENSTCGQEIMMEHSKLPRAENGRVKIDPNGCCEYVERTGKGK